MDPHRDAAAFADRIEQALRELGAWQATPPPDTAFESERAFFADSMSFYQWLQYVLLVRVREVVAERGDFPGDSQVGAYAVRELDGADEAHALVSLLCEFDAFIARAGRKTRRARRAAVARPDNGAPPAMPMPGEPAAQPAAMIALPVAPVDPAPAPALAPREVVQRWWHTRDAALLHPAPRSRAGFDTTLVDRVFGSVDALRQVLDDGSPCADGLAVRTLLRGWRGDWVVLTVLRNAGGEWRIDLPLSVAHTAQWLLRMRRDGGPDAADDSARGRALRYWNHVQNGNAHLARELQRDPDLTPPLLGTGLEEYFWCLRQDAAAGGVDVVVLMNAQSGCRELHTAMVEHPGGWRVDLARVLDDRGAPP